MILLLKCITLSTTLLCYSIAVASNSLIKIEDFDSHSNVAGQVQTAAFKNPPNEYRITQYQLTPSTLKQYPQHGIGGTMAFFYNVLYPQSRKNNVANTVMPSFSVDNRGASRIGKLVEAANAKDYTVWLADDWGYPSGMAGGRVVAENSNYAVKSITMLTVTGRGRSQINFALPEDLYDIIYATLYPVTRGSIDLSAGKQVQFSAKSIQASGISGNWELRVFARYVRDKDTQAQSTMSQFGHSGRYPDVMNRKAVSCFIASMHEPILAQIKDPARQVEGFYCNEPNLMQTHWERAYDAPYACAPWSDELADQFQQMHGYEIWSILPLIYNGQDDTARRARIHYRQAVAELFTDSFARQIREWCNVHGVKSSGHFLLNQDLSMHVQGYGDLMKFVSEFDTPALDIPIPNPDQFQDFAYQQSRFFSSVASWRKRDATLMLLDPIIGGYGRKRLSPDLPLLINSVNMASYHGVTFFTSYLPLNPMKSQHAGGSKQSANGYTKEDYTLFNEYTGRITQVLRGAQREAGVGLYYPIAMFQADLLASNKFWPKILIQHKERQQAWDRTERVLLDRDVEYMIVHPEAVAEAPIIDGKMQIGFGAYHTLVMPQLDFIPLAVAKQLNSFQSAGGTVIWVGQVPRGAEYAKNDRAVVAALRGATSIAVDDLASAISNSYSSEFDLSFAVGPDQLAVGRFHKGGQPIYLLVNRTQKRLSVEVAGNRVRGKAMGQLLDPSTGEIHQLKLPARLDFEANRSLLLMPSRKHLAHNLIKK
jgi:hypothetical protein